MVPTHHEAVDRSLDIARERLAHRLADIETLHLSGETARALATYLNFALAESDELIDSRERLALAHHEMRACAGFDRFTVARAARMGQRMACTALMLARRETIIDDATEA